MRTSAAAAAVDAGVCDNGERKVTRPQELQLGEVDEQSLAVVVSARQLE
jgi:hypothetical protein